MTLKVVLELLTVLVVEERKVELELDPSARLRDRSSIGTDCYAQGPMIKKGVGNQEGLRL
jgi:hypothetical protein